MLSNVETGSNLHYSPDLHNIRGKTVVIVGDASGIGRATAAQMVERGARVFIAVRSPAQLTAVFAFMANTGGDWDGMVANLSLPNEVKRFFDQAERRMGRIDVVINALSVDGGTVLLDGQDSNQNLCIEEAIQRMRNHGGNILNVNLPGDHGVSPALRRQAGENGIRMTLIEPGTSTLRETVNVYEVLDADDVARCIYESLIQPYKVDVVFLKGQFQKQPL